MRRLCQTFVLLTCSYMLSVTAVAHHSTSANFFEDQMIEIEGTITSARLRNPHVRFTVSVVDDAGNEVEWLVETNSLSGLRRRAVSTDVFAVGEKLRVAGNPGRQSETSLWATNILINGIREVTLDPGSTPRWSDDAEGMAGPTSMTVGDGSRPDLGIFRVWSHTKATNMLMPETVVPGFDLMSYPLTDAAKESVKNFDPVTQNPTRNCTPKGMPTIMEQPYPMRFTIERGNIVIYLEEYDTVRTVYMDTLNNSLNVTDSYYGHSVGHWEGNILLVRTTQMNWGWFNQLGIPLNDDAVVNERFILAADGSRLDYEMKVSAPSTFTKPVTLTKFWLYVPGVEVKPFDCLPD